MFKFLNLTPHPVNIYKGDKCVLRIPSCGSIRLTEESIPAISVAGIPCVKKEFVGVSVVLSQEFCSQVQDCVVIVSLPVIQEIKNNYNIYSSILKVLKEKNINIKIIVAPDTGNDSVVRNEKGQILGVKRFITIQDPEYIII